MAAQLLTAIPHASAVVDEPAHLASGYLALTQADLTVNREHPPLVKILAALALLPLAPVSPPDPAGGPARATEDFEFAWSREFLYRANDADRLLGAARLPIVALTLAAGAALYLWAGRVSGTGAALAALALFVFEPNLLAHGRLVTTDMGASLFGLVTLACLERGCASRGAAGRRWWTAGGVALGLALLTRFSSVLLIPVAALAMSLDTRLPGRARLTRGVAALGIALVVVNTGYGFSGTLFPLAWGGDPQTRGPLLTSPLAAMEASPLLRWTPVPLPRLYLEGLDLARYKNRNVEGPGYLNGVLSRDGWWSYFVAALAMKTTLPWLALAAGSIGLGLARRGDRWAIWALLPALALVALVTASTRAQIGLRYVLPAIPLLCLAGGTAALRLARALPALVRRPKGAGAALSIALPGLLIAWHAWSALAIHPYHLAYFNEAAGGPSMGHRRLVDSNLDWGQDLVGLDRFLEARGVRRVNLYYFGTADPAYYGIERAVPPEPGYFAVSATHLAGVYLPDPDHFETLRTARPETTIGHSILVYRFDAVPPFLKNPIRRP